MPQIICSFQSAHNQIDLFHVVLFYKEIQRKMDFAHSDKAFSPDYANIMVMVLVKCFTAFIAVLLSIEQCPVPGIHLPECF